MMLTLILFVSSSIYQAVYAYNSANINIRKHLKENAIAWKWKKEEEDRATTTATTKKTATKWKWKI